MAQWLRGETNVKSVLNYTYSTTRAVMWKMKGALNNRDSRSDASDEGGGATDTW